jgi:membrane protein
MSLIAVTPRRIAKILRDAIIGFLNNNNLSHAAAMAFYAATAPAPVLLSYWP